MAAPVSQLGASTVKVERCSTDPPIKERVLQYMGRAAALPKVVALVTTDRWGSHPAAAWQSRSANYQLPANALTLECGNLGHVASCVDPIQEGRPFAVSS